MVGEGDAVDTVATAGVVSGKKEEKKKEKDKRVAKPQAANGAVGAALTEPEPEAPKKPKKRDKTIGVEEAEASMPREAAATKEKKKKKKQAVQLAAAAELESEPVAASKENSSIEAMKKGKKPKPKTRGVASPGCEENADMAIPQQKSVKKKKKKKRKAEAMAVVQEDQPKQDTVEPSEAAVELPPKTKKSKKSKGIAAEDGNMKVSGPEAEQTEEELIGAVEEEAVAAAIQENVAPVTSLAQTRTAKQAFQRVRSDEWLGKKGSWNNSYEAAFGSAGYGAKAQEVRGKDFRHEKTKKKRGTYRGGAIDEGVRSQKFDSDDE